MNQKVKLVSSENDIFEVDKEVASCMKALDLDAGTLETTVSSTILAKMIEYSKHHLDVVEDEAWDAEFMKVDNNTVIGMIKAAYDLKIETLMRLTCSTFADSLKGRTTDEIRKVFNIKNHWTPEEEEEVRRQNAWAFE